MSLSGKIYPWQTITGGDTEVLLHAQLEGPGNHWPVGLSSCDGEMFGRIGLYQNLDARALTAGQISYTGFAMDERFPRS